MKKVELEGKSITELTILCMQKGLDPVGDKDTLIAKLLGKKEPIKEKATEEEAT